MIGKGRVALCLALAWALGGTATARAGAIPHLHIKGHLRADGSSDLRGPVTARSGLHVTNGLSADFLTVRGAAQLGGTLTVAGGLASNGLNAGSGAITTSGTVQAGALTINGDASIGGGLSLGKRLAATGADIGGGGLSVNGGISGVSASIGGALTAGTINTSGGINAASVSGATGTFTTLNVASGGTVNFTNARVVGLPSLTLPTNLTGASLQLTTSANGGVTGPQAITISQGAQTASLSVDSSGRLQVKGAGLSADALSALTVTTNQVLSSGTLTLNASSVATTHTLEVASAGNLLLDAAGNNAAHLIGNRDLRGQCTASGIPGTVATCSIFFTSPFGTTPIVVASPVGTDPSAVLNFAVRPLTTGFTISFNVSHPASITFDYVVEG